MYIQTTAGTLPETTKKQLLVKAKTVLRIMGYVFDDEITDIVMAALYDIETRGVLLLINEETQELHPLLLRAVLTYVRLHFGEPDDPERLRQAYETQLGQLMTTTGFTDWGNWGGV